MVSPAMSEVGGHEDRSRLRIEDYALLGDTHTAALVGTNGSIDWLCLPRFDSGACFAALLGGEKNGFWQIAPAGGHHRVSRRYRGETLVLETDFHTAEGIVRVVDCMPRRSDHASVVRVVEGISGRVPMRMELVVRFDYGWIVPWVRMVGEHLHGVAGPDFVCLATPVETRGENLRTIAEFSVGPGDEVPFVFSWHSQYSDGVCGGNAADKVAETEAWWRRWSERCSYQGPWRDAVVRSLITLKTLTYEPTGAVVAAATTSLPERLGGTRNWDYRYCWLRDATFSLDALIRAGYAEEATAWRDWLLRVAAGDPDQLQIVYGPAGERRLAELELDWLDGYEGSRPVRTGNAASSQDQLDVYGEVLDALQRARFAGMPSDPWAWPLLRALIDHVEAHWHEPDEGIWEVRSGPRQFTHSKVMAWVCIDRAILVAERFGREARSSGGESSEPRSTTTSACEGPTPCAAASSGRTARASSTPACSSSRSWGSCPPMTSVSSAQSRPYKASFPTTACFVATAPMTRGMPTV